MSPIVSPRKSVDGVKFWATLILRLSDSQVQITGCANKVDPLDYPSCSNACSHATSTSFCISLCARSSPSVLDHSLFHLLVPTWTVVNHTLSSCSRTRIHFFQWYQQVTAASSRHRLHLPYFKAQCKHVYFSHTLRKQQTIDDIN